MCIKLKYTNAYGESYYLAALGDPWPSRPDLRLVKRTTTIPKLAKCFDTPADAAVTLLLINNPTGWSIFIEDKAAKA